MTEENKLLNVSEMTKQVEAVTKFDLTKQDLQELVSVSQNITLADGEEVIKAKRLEIRGKEIVIEKQGKSFRDVFTAVNKQISAKENELLAITNPEIERLTKLEEQIAADKLERIREARLPERLERLEKISPDFSVDENDLPVIKVMSDNGFEAYYNKQVAKYNEFVAKRNAEEVAAKQKALDEEKEKAETERLAKEKEAADKLAAKEARIKAEAEAKRKEEEEKLRVEREAIAKKEAEVEAEKARLAKIEADRVEAERKAKEEAAAKALEEKMRPDREKILKYVQALEAVPLPDVVNQEAVELVQDFVGAWKDLVNNLLVK